MCVHAMDYVFSQYDLVLYDPSLFAEEDRDMLFQRIKKSQSSYCILYVYADVMKKFKNPHILDLVPSATLNSVQLEKSTEQMSLVLMSLK